MLGLEWKIEKVDKDEEGTHSLQNLLTHLVSGEHFYMCMLLNFVNGCTSFKSIRRMNGIDHKTYREACYALGLLDEDKEWNDCLSEAA